MKPVAADKINLLRSLLSGACKVVIVTHTHPDGDAVGSSFGFMHYIRESMGKSATVILPDPSQDCLDFIVGGNALTASCNMVAAVEAIASCDLLICLDMNGFNRSGCLEEALTKATAKKILVDHHLNPCTEAFDLVFSETGISSASELLYWVLLALEGSEDASCLPGQSAVALMTGMTTDTNNFANSVFPSTLTMASSLLAAGVDRDMVISELYNKYRENRVRAQGYFLDKLLHITDDGVAYMIVTEDVRKSFDLRDGETEGFVNIPLGIGRVKLSFLLKEDNGYYRVSIRSKKGISANRLATLFFNGGGHENAAGGRLYFPKDIASREGAAEYIETVTARFLQEDAPVQK